MANPQRPQQQRTFLQTAILVAVSFALLLLLAAYRIMDDNQELQHLRDRQSELSDEVQHLKIENEELRANARALLLLLQATPAGTDALVFPFPEVFVVPITPTTTTTTTTTTTLPSEEPTTTEPSAPPTSPPPTAPPTTPPPVICVRLPPPLQDLCV